jgi:arylsulfatase A-like enzyme
LKTILVLMDTMNRRCLQIYNRNAAGITPCIDMFARDSVVFDNHFVGSMPCIPARRDIFTGRMQFLERGWGGIEPFDRAFPTILKENGIFTHITTDHTHYFEIGGENYCALFNTWDYHRGQEFDPWVSRVKHDPPPDTYGQCSPQYLLNKTRFLKEEDYPSPKTFRSACEWLRDNRGSDDFFLMVETFDPHEPFDCPSSYHEMYGDDYIGKEFNWPKYAPVTEPPDALAHLEKCYLGTLSMVDRWFGKLIDVLKETDMYEDTLIILTSDHGHMLGEHGYTGKNYMHAYNELSHIPLIVHMAGQKNAGKHIAALTQNIDLMPTILEHHRCGIPGAVKGRSLSPLIEGGGEPREQVIYGLFGRAVNVCDGEHTYFRAPKSAENKPLYMYCGIPSTLWRYFGEEYAPHIDMGRFLPYTNYPVYRIPPMNDGDCFGEIKYVLQSELYNIQKDYPQSSPIHDPKLEAVLCKKLTDGMLEAEAPAEQYERLGLEKYLER